MRILTISNVPLDRALGSGAMVVGYAERLRAAGHEVELCGPEHYVWLPRLRAGRRLRTVLGYSRATLQALRTAPFDLVELWGGEAWWVADRIARRRVRPWLVARSNGLEPHFAAALRKHRLERPGTVLGSWLDRRQNVDLAFRRADLLTTVSHFDRRFALAQGYQPATRVLTLENPMPDDWLGQARRLECPPVLGFLGSTVPNKGAALLLAVLGQVLPEHPAWRVRWFGGDSGSVIAALPADVASRVECVPFVADRARLRESYRGCAIIVLPSAFESFGLVGAEALACGCLLIASPTGLAADLVPQNEAVIVPERTATAWSEALQGVLSDDARRRRIAEAGQRRAQCLRWATAIEALLARYQDLIAVEPAAARRQE